MIIPPAKYQNSDHFIPGYNRSLPLNYIPLKRGGEDHKQKKKTFHDEILILIMRRQVRSGKDKLDYPKSS